MQTTYIFPFYFLILFIYLFILQLTLYGLIFLGNDTTMKSIPLPIPQTSQLAACFFLPYLTFFVSSVTFGNKSTDGTLQAGLRKHLK